MPTVLIVTDTDAVADEVVAAVGDEDTTLVRVRTGLEVHDAVTAHHPDLVVTDLQIGAMGGMAVSRHLRLEAEMGRLPDTSILVLLDREADIFLAKRAEVDGWIVKPLDSFRLRRATRAILAGERYEEQASVPTIPPVAADS